MVLPWYCSYLGTSTPWYYLGQRRAARPFSPVTVLVKYLCVCSYYIIYSCRCVRMYVMYTWIHFLAVWLLSLHMCVHWVSVYMHAYHPCMCSYAFVSKVCVHIRIHIHIYSQACMHAALYLSAYGCYSMVCIANIDYMCMYIYIYCMVCMCICTCICIFCLDIYIYIYIYVYIYI